jgi:hypothetical protein
MLGVVVFWVDRIETMLADKIIKLGKLNIMT